MLVHVVELSGMRAERGWKGELGVGETSSAGGYDGSYGLPGSWARAGEPEPQSARVSGANRAMAKDEDRAWRT